MMLVELPMTLLLTMVILLLCYRLWFSSMSLCTNIVRQKLLKLHPCLSMVMTGVNVACVSLVSLGPSRHTSAVVVKLLSVS